MTATEDLFTPIHKAIRSMIYDVGSRLQRNDFTDIPRSKPVLDDLEHEFSAAISSGCIVCLLHHHASDEETAVFPEVAKHDAALVQGFIDDHHKFTRQVEKITTMSHELVKIDGAEDRILSGVVLNQEVNSFFAAYIDHMNREEETLVPLMREKFTDEQMRTMRSTIMRGLPPDQMATIFRWMFPSLNVTELTGLFDGIKATAPPPFLQFAAGVAAERVPPEQWQKVRERVGI